MNIKEKDSLPTGKTCPTCQASYSADAQRCTNDNSLLAVVKRDPFIGTVIADRFEIKEEIGKGGFSTVYLANQISLNREVAIKILHSDFANNPIKTRRFQNEAEAISCLSHPNIAGVHDYGVLPEGQPYLVMEYARGKTISELVKEKGLFHSQTAVPLFIQACDGMAQAHSKGLVHRDIKPSNIILVEGDDGNLIVKILDFGLAKMITGDDDVEDLTRTGEVLGTPAYMSPEQCRGEMVDKRTDIYSFGCVMYMMLSGKQPLAGENTFELINKQISYNPPPLSRQVSDIPKRLEKIVSKTLAKEPDDRFQSFVNLKDALMGKEATPLEKLRSIFSSETREVTPKKHLLVRRITYGTTFGIIALLAVFSTQFLLNQHDTIKASNRENEFLTTNATYRFPPLSFQYSSIFEPFTTEFKDPSVRKRFKHRFINDAYIDFKHFGYRDIDEIVAVQDKYHKSLPGFQEISPFQWIKFGKQDKFRGYQHIFTHNGLEGKALYERHVYFIYKNDCYKFKMVCFQKDLDRISVLFDQLLESCDAT